MASNTNDKDTAMPELTETPKMLGDVVDAYEGRNNVADMQSCFMQLVTKELEIHGHTSLNAVYGKFCNAHPDMIESFPKPRAVFALMQIATKLSLKLKQQDDLQDVGILKGQD